MILYLKNFEVIYPGHSKHGKSFDFIIKNGKFLEIGKKLKAPKKVDLSLSNGCLSPGFVDVGTTISSPGYEHRESIESTLTSAANGGFTELIAFPNTLPVVDNASNLKAVTSQADNHAVSLHVCGSITKQCAGTSLSEMHDLHTAGAVAFSDGHHSLENEGSLYRALQYATPVDKVVINQPRVSALASDWQMNEGKVNITLGLPGQNEIIEDIAVNKDLSINAYAQGKLMVHKISTATSADAVYKQKAKSTVYSSVAYLNLTHADNQLEDFDTNWKVDPPLRSDSQRKKLIKALQKGKVDVICSGHTPVDTEGKKLEFSEADFGVLGLETAFSALLTYCPELSLDTIVNALAVTPRQIFNLELPEITEGQLANITLYDRELEFTYVNQHSESTNHPLLGSILKGKILGILAAGKYLVNKN